MSSHSEFHEISVIFLLIGYLIICGCTKKIEKDINIKEIRSGKYVPQAFGAGRGKYIPDDSGRYHHIFIPYTGGYGDNGLPYMHQEPPPPRKPIELGPDDHVRLLLDYNYQSGGWQIVQFDWTHDDEYGKPQPKFSYEKKFKLWDNNGDNDEMYERSDYDGYEYSQNVGNDRNETETSGWNNLGTEYGFEYQTEGDSATLKYDYEDQTETSEATHQAEVNQAIGDVLDYVKTNLLPSFL